MDVGKYYDEFKPDYMVAKEGLIGRIFCKDNYVENGLPERAEILAINGVSIDRMINDVMKYVPSTLPHHKQTRFAELFSLFTQTYYDMPSPWEITCKYNGIVSKITVQGIRREAYTAAQRKEFSKSEIEKPYLTDKASNQFHGKVYILTSHETFSAGTVFAGLFKDNHLGTIIGRETGGRVSMLSDMWPVFLPNSNFMYLVPTAKLILSDDNSDRGVLPDINVDLTPEDYMNGKDPDIENVVRLIRADSEVNNK